MVKNVWNQLLQSQPSVNNETETVASAAQQYKLFFFINLEQ